jgi:hypothetical protein
MIYIYYFFKLYIVLHLGSTSSEFESCLDSHIRFSNYIRAGKSEAIIELFKSYNEKSSTLLETVYTFQINFKNKSSFPHKTSNNRKKSIASLSFEDDYTATFEVSPLHLAIISKQKLSLEVILQEGTAALSQFPQNIEKQKMYQLFGAKIKVTFPSGDGTLYEDEERMMDGMNILHLAAKYYPEGLEAILSFARNYDGLKVIKHLLFEKDNQINNTPLHVAAASSTIVALRYIHSLICIVIYIFIFIYIYIYIYGGRY